MQSVLTKISEKQWPIIIFIFAFAIYSNTIFNDYNLDDNLVTQNHRLTSKGISAIPEIFKSFYYEDEMGYKYGYRPVTHVSFAIEHSLFGEKASISHAINVFLYAISCLLIFFFVRKLKPDISPYFAVLVAMLFAVHPIHTEVVASIKNRDEILSLLFGLVALIFIFSVKDKETFLKKFFVLGLILVSFSLSILSKNSTALFSIIIPVVYLLFVNHKKLIYPILGCFLLTCINAYFLNIQLKEIIILYFVSFLILISTFFLYSENCDWIKHKCNQFINSSSFIYFLFFIVFLLLAVAFFTEIHNLLFLVFLLLSIGVFLSKSDNIIFKISILIFASVSFISLILSNQNLLIIGFLALLVLNNKRILESKRKWFSVVVLTILLSTILNEFQMPSGIEVLIIILFFASIYFKPLLFIVPFMLATKFGHGFLVVFSSLIGFLILGFFFFENRLKKDFLFPANKKITIGFILMALFVLNYEGNFNAASNQKISNTVNIAQEENEIDRPLLLIENPLIENWNYEHRIPTAFTTIKFYLQKLILPYPLLFYYGYDKVQIANFKTIDFYIALVIILLLLIIAFYNFKKRKLLSFGILFMLINLVPYSNLMTPVAGIVGERLAYVSSFGFVIFLASLFMFFYKKFKFKKGFFAFVFLLILVSTSYTFYRNSLWKNKIVLFNYDIKHLEQSAQANALLAYAYLYKSNLNNGLKYLNKAITIYPNFLNWWNDKAKIEDQLGQVENAIHSYEKTLAIDSTFSNEPYMRLSLLNANLKQYHKAIFYMEKAIQKGENYPDQYNALASFFVLNNEPNLAIKSLKVALNIYPNSYELNLTMGKIYFNLGNELALIFFKKAFSLNDSDPKLLDVIKKLE